VLEDMYGKNGYAMLVDEGGSYQEQSGTVFAVPGIAEKGYLDTRVTVKTPGGHSSLPPDHTSIGILAQMLVHLEANPIPAVLRRATPLYRAMQCYAEHGKGLPDALRDALRKSVHSDKHLKQAQDILFKDPDIRSLAGTTQAIDLVQGGHKTNALPEEAWAVINHRVATDSSISATQKSDTQRLVELAERFNLSFTAFGQQISPAGAHAYRGSLTLEDAWNSALEPAPITPTGADAVPFQVLSGTIRAVHNRGGPRNESDIVVAPGIMGGNTDTLFYWNLTEHIFRYNHNNADGGDGNIHTINEHIRVDDFIETIRFFAALILNADETAAM